MVEIPYVCSECAAHGVKLWRQYQTFLSHITLKCRECSEIEQAPTLERHGRLLEGRGESLEIGWRVPALPDDTGTFWGYCSAPKERWDWWKALPEKNIWKKKGNQ